MKGAAMQADQILDKAADLLDRDGWKQGDTGRPGGPRCAAGAMGAVAGVGTGVLGLIAIGRSDNIAAFRNAADALVDAIGLEAYGSRTNALYFGCAVSEIARWNDRRWRTKEEVTSAMRMAAVMLRARSPQQALETTRSATTYPLVVHLPLPAPVVVQEGESAGCT